MEVSEIIGIGLPRSALISMRGTSFSVVVARTTPVSSIRTGFVLFALFNDLPLYLFNPCREAADSYKRKVAPMGWHYRSKLQSVSSNKSSITAVWNRFNIFTKQGIDFTPCSFDFGTLIGEFKIPAWL